MKLSTLIIVYTLCMALAIGLERPWQLVPISLVAAAIFCGISTDGPVEVGMMLPYIAGLFICAIVCEAALVYVGRA